MNYRRNEDKWCTLPVSMGYNDVRVISEVESVLTPPTEPVLLEDFKVHARIDSTDEDTYHESLLKQCRKLFERVTGIGLVVKTMTVAVRNEKGDVALPYAPYSSITSVADQDGTAIVSGNYEFIDSVYLRTPVSEYTKVVYVTAPQVTEDIKLAIMQLASFYSMNRGDNSITGKHYNQMLHDLAAPFKRTSWLL